MAGFLPSKELAQERRRNCWPLFIAASGFITGLIYLIFAFRHRNIAILYSWLAIAAFIVVWRQLFEVESSGISIYMIFNFIVYSKYGAACVHFISIFFITYICKENAIDNFLSPFVNEKDAFPLKVRKTKSLLKNIFDIDTETVNEIYDFAKIGNDEGLASIEGLNRALIEKNLEPVQFCKKDGLKIIPEKLRANFAKTPKNKKKIFTKKTKATANKESSSFSESFQTIITYGGGGLIGVFIVRAAKEILSN